MSKKRAANGTATAGRNLMQAWLSNKPHQSQPAGCCTETRSNPPQANSESSVAPPPHKKSRRQDSAMPEDPATADDPSATAHAEPTQSPPPPLQATPAPPSSQPLTLTIHEQTADLFAAPPNTLLIHACNCAGSWGAGIAAAFKSRYPQAYARHRAHCKARTPDELVGTAQLIPPVDADKKGDKHWVGCVFTSKGYGKRKDGRKEILEATGRAVRELLRLVEEANGKADGGAVGKIGEVRMCRINAGLFGVPWEETRRVLEGIVVSEGGVRDITVCEKG